MSPDTDREVAVFSAARRLPAAQRAAYLREACLGDATLRQHVEDLLRASEEVGGFLQDPAPGAQRSVDVATSTNALPNTVAGENVGDRIGRFKLLQQIGEGGCGVVYMAEQEEPVRRRVALKVIKLGMDTRQVIARFEAERQALALMDHPNIAKVLEAGATDTGRPYFVMELVRGIKITHYCDESNLSTEERLDLFIKVAQAVQHAHQKGIIHRDIKPSNILVADHDGVPVPKIIDFGIAKATTDQRLTDKTLFTAFEQFIGTPAYMSPEQARMSGLDIDTRTDIYSLGVLLYELLTGKTPFDAQDLLAAGLDEMRHTIREKEPVRPSTRLSTMLEGELTTAAKHRHTDAPKLVHLIRGDLDWIVMKALEKDRARRYETAKDLSMDVHRYLNTEPVTARPPTQLYSLQKLVRRNKLAFAAGSALLAALIIGLGVSSWLFFRERQTRQRAVAAEQQQARLRQQAEADEKKAKAEAVKSQQVTQFLEDMLKSVGPKVVMGRDTQLLRDILDDTADRTARDLKYQPGVAAEVLSTIAVTYLQLFDLKKAESMHREALRLRRSLFGETNAVVASSLNDLARVLIMRRGTDNITEAAAMARQALSIWEKLSTNHSEDVALSLYLLGSALHNQGKPADAESAYRMSLAICRRLFGNENKNVATVRDRPGLILTGHSRREDSEQTSRETMTNAESYENWHPSMSRLLHELASALRDQGKVAEAEATDHEAAEQARRAANKAAEAGDTVASNNLAWLLATSPFADLRDGASAVSFAEKTVAATNRKNPSYLDTLAAAYAETGQFTDAVLAQKEAIALLNDEQLKRDYGFRLKLYESNFPYHDGDDGKENFHTP
jgi:eukaryotic-like serine/threonine-protein kinase